MANTIRPIIWSSYTPLSSPSYSLPTIPTTNTRIDAIFAEQKKRRDEEQKERDTKNILKGLISKKT